MEVERRPRHFVTVYSRIDHACSEPISERHVFREFFLMPSLFPNQEDGFKMDSRSIAVFPAFILLFQVVKHQLVSFWWQ